MLNFNSSSSLVTCLRVHVSVSYQCWQGKSCRRGGKCLSRSQWCDSVIDCPDREDEAHCSKTRLSCCRSVISAACWVFKYVFLPVRLHGTEFLLQSYSPENQGWMPVCAENWTHQHGRAACEQMGYKRFVAPLLVIAT